MASRICTEAMSSLDDLISDLTQQPHRARVKCHLPLIYRAEYDIKLWGLESLHQFDTTKWGRVAAFVLQSLHSKSESGQSVGLLEPSHCITEHELSLVHDERFIHNVIHSKQTLVNTSEVCLLYLLPMFVLQRHLITPLRYQTTGTALGSFVALKFNAAINIGGGFHHCSARRSAGFCFFADITLSIRCAWNYFSQHAMPMAKILIVDCDAHQGNGYARDVLLMSNQEKDHVYILDLYNARIYPRDEAAKTAINREVLLPPRVEDEEYLRLLKFHLNATFETDKFHPNFLIYNAGTDILRGDPLGRLGVSANGIIQRDEIVFSFAQQHNIPILMLLSGGYQRNNARIIADSILHLIETNLVKPINLLH